MPHVVYYVAASLDGRIAGPADDLSFLETVDGPERFGAEAFDAFFETVDALVMGGATFRFIRDAIARGDVDGWPYGDRPTWVMTRDATPPDIPGAAVQNFDGAPAMLMDFLDRAGFARVWLAGGGLLAGAFLAADLVDELVLTIAPTFLGAGPAIADGADLPLRRFRLTTMTRGVNSAALRYLRER